MRSVAEPHTTGNTRGVVDAAGEGVLELLDRRHLARRGSARAGRRRRRRCPRRGCRGSRARRRPCRRGSGPLVRSPSSYRWAVSDRRSATPWNAPSLPIGSSSGATPAPNASRSSASVASNDDRSRSSLLTKIMRGSAEPSALAPQAPGPGLHAVDRADHEHGEVGDLQRRRPPRPTKSGSPGVSIRLILWPFHSNGARARPSDTPRCCSSGSKSHDVVPSSTRPARSIAPGLRRAGLRRAWSCPSRRGPRGRRCGWRSGANDRMATSPRGPGPCRASRAERSVRDADERRSFR